MQPKLQARSYWSLTIKVLEPKFMTYPFLKYSWWFIILCNLELYIYIYIYIGVIFYSSFWLRMECWTPIHVPICHMLSDFRSSNFEIYIFSIVPGPRTHTRYGNRAFCVCASKLCNNLPTIIRNAPTVETFKIRLKTYLFHVK